MAWIETIATFWLALVIPNSKLTKQKNYSILFSIFLLRGMENSCISGFTSKTCLSNTYFP